MYARTISKSEQLQDTAYRSGLAASGLAVLMISLLIFGFVLLEALPALFEIGPVRFFTDAGWHPASGQFNLLPMLAGSLAVTVGAVLIATPVGVASALFCRFYGPPRLAQLYRTVLELLAGIPSIIFGFWGLVVVVPYIAALQQPGTSILAATLVLSLMLVPTVALVCDAAFGAVPDELIKGAAALGISRWTTIRQLVFPTARSGIGSAVALETGRAIGETMAVLLVCGNVVRLPESIFSPVRTLTTNIALEMAYAMGTHRSALFVSGLLLLILVLTLLCSVRKKVHT